jgi:hypothetical protein
MARVTIELKDKPSGNVSVTSYYDPPLPCSVTGLTRAQRWSLVLLDALEKMHRKAKEEQEG